ncbi:MAG: hypothetical protein Q8P30_01860 [Candidatus Uhrbacteria bacterium]|nr:hypothetical protein [Candidatus Uhrbacteria bacterium]
MKISSTTSMIGLAVLVIAGLIVAGMWKNYAPGEYDDFAKDLTEAGVVMYGTYWCPNCAAQKEAFGSSFRHIEYIECSSPGSKTFDLCPDIKSVPYWVNEEGVNLTGKVSLQTLADTFGVLLNRESTPGIEDEGTSTTVEVTGENGDGTVNAEVTIEGEDVIVEDVVVVEDDSTTGEE